MLIAIPNPLQNNHDWHALKWIAEGCESLSEVVERAEAQARYLRERLDAG